MVFYVLLAELVALYFLSRWVTKALFMFFLLIFRARSVAISLLLVLEFPGTVIHELAHLFTAEILGVKTGKLRLEPESIREDDITSGSVMISESDPFRRYARGLAPLFAGIIVLTALSYFLSQALPQWHYWGLGYLMFAVSNSMFSSPADLKGFIPFAITVGILIASAYFLGIRIALTGQILEVVTRILTTLTQSLGVVLGVNVALLFITKLLSHIIGRFLTR